MQIPVHRLLYCAYLTCTMSIMPKYLTEKPVPDIDRVREIAKYDSLQTAKKEAVALYQRALLSENTTTIAETAMLLAYIKRQLRNYDEALLLYESALAVWKEKGDNNHIATCIMGMEIIRCNRGANSDAIKNISVILEFENILPETRIHCYLSLGTVYAIAGDCLSALEQYNQALDLAREQNLNEEYQRALMSIGEMYLYVGEHTNAIRCLQDVLQFPVDQENKMLYAYTNAVLSDVYMETNAWQDALSAANQSCYHYDKAGSAGGKALALARKAIACRSMGLYDEAYQCLMNAESELNSSNVIHLRKNFLLHMGWLFSIQDWSKHDFIQAKQLLQQCMELCDRLGDKPTKLRSLELLANIYEQEKDYYTALMHRKQLHELYEEQEDERMRNYSDISEMKNQLRLSKRERELLAEKNQELAVLNTQLRQQTEQLADQQRDIERYNVELMQSNLELQRSYEQKSEVVAIAAHQLKSPLIEMQYLAQDGLLRATEPQVRKDLEEIKGSAAQMLANVDRFITLSSIGDRNSLTITRVQVDAVIGDIVSMLAHNAAQKNISIVTTLEENLHASTDEFALTQIVENLLSNAIKYSPAHGRVQVRSSSVREGNTLTSVMISICDEGKGFSESDKLHIFEKYRRLSAQPTGNESSTGLGLSIVKNFVTALGGTITIESQEGSGALFTVRIPCR